jgi:molybdate-binding protein
MLGDDASHSGGILNQSTRRKIISCGKPPPLGETARYRRLASDHRGVIEAVRGGWADAGVAPRMMALTQDPRFKALLATLQSGRYRRLLNELPGYDSRLTGELL